MTAYLARLFSAAERQPLPVLQVIGSLLGELAFRCSRRYRDVALKNLTIAYGDRLTRRDKLALTRRVFINFARSAMEFPVLARLPADKIRELVEWPEENRRRSFELLERHGSLIAVSAHFGNFELLAQRIALESAKLTVVVRNDDNAAVTALVNRIREESGYKVIGRGQAVRGLLRLLRKGQGDIAVMLPDQKSDDVFVPFFGTLCGTVAGPALLSLRCDKPIVPAFMVRLPGNRHRIEVGEPIYPAPTGDVALDTERLMTRVNLAIEEMVRRYPDHWLWLHDRWRVRPSEEVAAQWRQRHGSDPPAMTPPLPSGVASGT